VGFLWPAKKPAKSALAKQQSLFKSRRRGFWELVIVCGERRDEVMDRFLTSLKKGSKLEPEQQWVA
jgi:hypothetical protein